ncbi:hypothetical protein NDU88_003457 [Pleurodeles waltl]|uniref:Uncharacterized protein n=1 Tax=Pleurodeles waltl TaxID=8319 RepID=A0AAV7T668_PLEWA|nr:hypothetical protein NDU88_003457 [Pleurodeles waltl]
MQATPQEEEKDNPEDNEVDLDDDDEEGNGLATGPELQDSEEEEDNLPTGVRSPVRAGSKNKCVYDPASPVRTPVLEYDHERYMEYNIRLEHFLDTNEP